MNEIHDKCAADERRKHLSRKQLPVVLFQRKSNEKHLILKRWLQFQEYFNHIDRARNLRFIFLGLWIVYHILHIAQRTSVLNSMNKSMIEWVAIFDRKEIRANEKRKLKDKRYWNVYIRWTMSSGEHSVSLFTCPLNRL